MRRNQKTSVNRRRMLSMLGAGGGILSLGWALRGIEWTPASDAEPAGPSHPDSPPPRPVTAIRGYGDLSAVFSPDWTVPAAAADGFSEISTPAGDGFEFVVPPEKITPWDSTCKAILAVLYPATSPIGHAERWTFQLLIPRQPLADTWHTGVLWEFHTEGSSGHHLSLNSDANFRIGRDIAPVGSRPSFDYTIGPAVPWDRWVTVTMELKWSTVDDGYYKVWIDGIQYVNAVGVATVFTGEPYLQFGWYSHSEAGITNRVRFGGIRREDL